MRRDERERLEVEALLTDRYLESLLARATAATDPAPADADLEPASAPRPSACAADLVRVHPSFRFEERLAARLAEAAAAAAVPAAVGAEGTRRSRSPGRGAPGRAARRRRSAACRRPIAERRDLPPARS